MQMLIGVSVIHAVLVFHRISIVPAVRRSLAVPASGAAAARGIGRKALVFVDPVRRLATHSILCSSGIAAFCALLPDTSDGGAEMAGDRYGLAL